jgi:membrane-bound lytic murein transglycosylase D
MYVAATYGVNYYSEHNLRPLPVNIPVSTDTIMVNKDIHLIQISDVMGIPIEELRALNPQYKTGLVPGSSRPMALILPMNHLGDFIDLNDTIRSYKRDVYLNKSTQIADPSHSSNLPGEVKGKTKLIYTVKDGDNLGFISGWYRVSVSDIRYWNNLYRNTIRVGQKLAIYVEPSRSEYYSKLNSMSFEDKQMIVGKTVPVNTPPVAVIQEFETDGEFITYTVRNGDTIWDIVKMYDNVTTSQVMALNNISDPEKIKVGQKLKIRKKS